MAYAFAEFNMLEKGDNNLNGSSLLILFCMFFSFIEDDCDFYFTFILRCLNLLHWTSGFKVS